MPRPSLVILLVLALTPAAFAQATAEDEAAVKSVVAKFVDARAASDAKALNALFTDDADQLVSDGTWRKGRTSLVEGMIESTRKSPAKRTVTVETVRLVTPDVALADGRYHHEATDATQNRDMQSSFVLRRTVEGWKISAIRNMLPAKAP